MMGARMGAMYRLKAYFGMVPAEEMGEYTDEPVQDRYADDQFADGRRSNRSSREYTDDRWDDRFTYEDEPQRDRYDGDWDRRTPRPVAVDRSAARIAAASGCSAACSSSARSTSPTAAWATADQADPTCRTRTTTCSVIGAGRRSILRRAAHSGAFS